MRSAVYRRNEPSLPLEPKESEDHETHFADRRFRRGPYSPGLLAAQDLPAAVTALGLTDIEIREKPRAEYGRNVHGTLPGGTRVEVELDRNGEIEEIEARGRGRFPAETVRSLIPAAVLANSSWPADATLEKVEFERGGRIEIEGHLDDGANSMPNSPPTAD